MSGVNVEELPVVQHALRSTDPVTIAASLKTVISFQRTAVAAGDAIEPWWAETGWATIDRLMDALAAALPPRELRR